MATAWRNHLMCYLQCYKEQNTILLAAVNSNMVSKFRPIIPKAIVFGNTTVLW